MKIYRLDGKVINIGEWDTMPLEVEHGVFEAGNPIPANAIESDEEVVTGWDGGFYLHDDPRQYAPK